MQIILFLILVIALVALFANNSAQMDKQTKIYITLGAFVLFGLMYFYESSKNNTEEYSRQIVSAFTQGKELLCDARIVSNKDFIYVSGTNTFMPRDGKMELQGIIIEVATCTLQN